uniref:Uncharacterized protein n=1 Tax=Romanomermis culicivorax TaxID=13658 RepID=A0A915HJG6_ROMCU
MALVMILALIAIACLMSSRRRSTDRFQRRLQAAGVSAPLAREMMTAALDEKTRSVLADLPLFTTYAGAGFRTRAVGISRHQATLADTLNWKKGKTLGGKQTTATTVPTRRRQTAPKLPASKAKTGVTSPSNFNKRKA